MPTETIAGAVRAGESFGTAADEYDLTLHEVVLACWWEAQPGQQYHKAWRRWAQEASRRLVSGVASNIAATLEPPIRTQSSAPDE